MAGAGGGEKGLNVVLSAIKIKKNKKKKMGMTLVLAS